MFLRPALPRGRRAVRRALGDGRAGDRQRAGHQHRRRHVHHVLGRARAQHRARDGHAEGRYDKIHLFDALGNTESRHIAPGREPVIVRAGHYGVGLTVCYDVRFPGLYTALGRSGAHAILVAASWAPGPHKVHQWRSAAIARAMDSTCFIIAIGQAAVGDVDVPGPPTGVGHSMVVDPTGTVLLELGEAPDIQRFTLNAGMQANAEILLGTRTVMEYLLSPVRKQVHDSGRER